MYDDYRVVWVIAACVLLFLTSFPALAIFFCSLCVVRRRKDPSRDWLIWFRAGFILFSLAGFSCFLVNLFAVLFSDLYVSQYEYDDIHSKGALPVQVEIDLLGTLLSTSSDVCVVLALSGLDRGIIIAHNTEPSHGHGGVPPGTIQLFDKVFHFAICGLAAVLFVLSIIAFGIGQHLYSAFGLASSRIGYDHSYVGSSYTRLNLGRTSHLLSLAMYAMSLAVILSILFKSITTKVRCRGDRRVTMASTYLIVCSSLFALRGIYIVGYTVAFSSRHGSTNIPPSLFTVIDVVSDTWPEFVVFCILFALGCKKRGLWSTKQPFPSGLLDVTPQQSPRSYSHNTTSLQSEADVESNIQEPQMHEMLQVTSHEQQLHESMPRREIPRHLVHTPQLQAQQQHIREALEAEGTDDSPPDYYSARHQESPRHPPQPSLSCTLPGGTVQAHAGPSFALPTHQACGGMLADGSPPPHAEAMGLYHQADGRMPQSQPLPYNEKG
ncbi:hypothetical protein NOR_01147 [Metarhizium rileyi]|uniref:Uncharacterized protein n=1 Tax=Metarhizium rileyi (strain RCEF 4871) TaxID=1649241 RepID=A0A167JSN7_METRR|nr:hypothetical protein NOR_01147 [Metarhizium rileyi RCEF 4871]TWU76067.1 hypothetical protein ED733_007482 [Metarhizium rileyi]